MHPVQVVGIFYYPKPHTCWHTDPSKETHWLYYWASQRPTFALPSSEKILSSRVRTKGWSGHSCPETKAVSSTPFQIAKTGTANFKGIFVGFLLWLWFYCFIIDFSEFKVQFRGSCGSNIVMVLYQQIMIVQHQMSVKEEKVEEFLLALKQYLESASAQGGCLQEVQGYCPWAEGRNVVFFL